MQYQLYSSPTPADRLILYFNGWAMTPEAVEHLIRPEGYDLLIVWDYRSLDLDFDLSVYKAISLVAWSMGVWAADRFALGLAEALPLERAVAICGTGYPVDDAWGIPQAVFEGTMNGLSEANRVRFNRRMCGGKTYRHLFEALAKRSTDEIKAELEAVYRHEVSAERSLPKADALRWSLALIGQEDRIIPADNQLAYWRGQGVESRMDTNAAHYLLGGATTWEELWA